MLEITRIRENKTEIIELLKLRNMDAAAQIEKIIAVDADWRSNKQKQDSLLAESNALAKEIGQLFKLGKREEAEEAKKRGGEIRDEEKKLDEVVGKLADELQSLLYEIPNVPHSSVPLGNSDEDNVKI